MRRRGDGWAKPGQKNAHGVYTPTEVLELPPRRKDWRGCPLAEIALVRTHAGWRGTICVSLTTGSWSGSSAPLMDSDPLYPSRDNVLEAMCARLRRRARRETDEAMRREVSEIVDWTESLQPVQGDLLALLG